MKICPFCKENEIVPPKRAQCGAPACKRAQAAAYFKRRLETDPEFRKRHQRHVSEYIKRRRKTDPEFRKRLSRHAAKGLKRRKAREKDA